MQKRCENYSIENKQCKFWYTPALLVSSKDLIPRCDGFKSEVECTWFKGYHLDIAGNDSRLKKFRDRVRNEDIQCGVTPCELCWKYKKCLKEVELKNHEKLRAEKELKEREKAWENMLHD